MLDCLQADGNAEEPGFDVVALQEVCCEGTFMKSLKQGFSEFEFLESPVCLYFISTGWPLFRFLQRTVALINEFVFTFLISGYLAEMIFHSSFAAFVYTLLGSPIVFGNAIVARKNLKPAQHEDILIGGSYRLASRVLLHLDNTEGESCKVWVVNTHLHDALDDAQVRMEQIEKILAWITTFENEATCVVLLGDLNANPREECIGYLKSSGFVSCYASYHSKEPHKTYHQKFIIGHLGHQVEPEECYDYIFVKEISARVNVVSAELFGDKESDLKDAVYPSDHFGITSHLEIYQ